MKQKDLLFIRGNNSFMSVAMNILFMHISKHAQILEKDGTRCFSDRSIADINIKYKQFNAGAMPGNAVFGCTEARNITVEEKKQALDAVNLINKQLCGKLKERSYADGINYKRFLQHGETIFSPTVSLEAIIGTFID